MPDDKLVDDTRLCEDSPFNLEVDHYSTGVGELLFQRQRQATTAFRPEVLVDCFHGVFSHEVALHPNADFKAEAWWREFFSSGEAERLRSKTKGNHQLAEAAVWDIARKLVDYCNSADETAGQDGESYGSINKRIRSVRDAVEDANEDVEDAKGIAASLGDGIGGKVSLDEFQQLCDRLKRSKSLRTMLDLAGGMLKFRMGTKKKKVDGFDMVDGVMQSGDITRLLPSEIMQLAAGPTLATNMLRRMVENQTLALRKYSQEKIGRGPIVVVIDGSASMDWSDDGNEVKPIHQAKALALTMARIALEQKRWIALVEFGSIRQWKELVMPPDKWDTNALVNWLEHFHDGGTDFGVLSKVVDAWPRWNCPVGQADIIFATDGDARLGSHIVKKFNDFKAEKNVKCYGLAINSDTGDLPLVCDKTWTTHSMGLESSAVRELLTNS